MRNNKTKIIVFDFDGVVCDSTDECMVTSWNAWQKWNDKPGFRVDLGEFSDEEKAGFRKLRPYVRGAGEYYILQRSLEEGPLIKNQNSFEQLWKKWLDHLTPFKALFYGSRDKLRKKDLEGWIKLHPVFNDVISVMKQLEEEERLYVATLKDGESVRLILEYHGLYLSPNRLLDQSQISSKLEALDRFLKEEKASKDDLIFLDDNVTHLLDPQKAGYNILLTGWGPSLEEYRQLAIRKNIPVIMTIDEGNL